MDWLHYKNQGATRNKPISKELATALSFLPEMGVSMEVFSGGQAPKGSGGPRTGSTRHDHGHAADAFFYKDGKRLDWANPDHQPIFQDIVRRARANGVSGIGAGEGYMQPGSMHIGFGNAAVWGAGGKGANAPDWLRAAHSGHEGHNHGPHSGNTPPAPPQASETSLLGGIAEDTLDTPMQTGRPGGILGSLFPDMSEDRADKIRLAINGMLHNPNAHRGAAIRQGMQDRRTDRREEKRLQLQSQQANKTAAWLAKQPGGGHYAQAIESGALNARDGVSMWQAQTKRPKQSAKEQQIARIKSAYGVGDQEAVGIADGVLNVSRDPYDQSVVVTNLATGESYAPNSAARASSQSPDAVPAITQTTLPPSPDASEGFGLEGMVKGAINSASDFVGAGTPYEGVQETQSNFAVLREGLVNDISQGYGRQPPSWLLKNIQDLTPQTGGAMGSNAAQSKLTSLQRSFQTELEAVQKQLGGRIAPQQERVLSERAAALQSALGKVGQALGSFGTDSSNTTKSGVQWRIEQ